MAIQDNNGQADELEHVYSEGERLFCRIHEYSELAHSGVTAFDYKFQMTQVRNQEGPEMGYF